MKILLIVKRSMHDIYFEKRKMRLEDSDSPLMKTKMKTFKEAHKEHYQTLDIIERTLKNFDMMYTKRMRGSNFKTDGYDLVISCGGDGTFLEAARKTTHQIILGVNSNPHFSVGKLCLANKNNFEDIIRMLKKDNPAVIKTYRLKISFGNSNQIVTATNDVLFAHKNPAAMSRYLLRVGKQREEQRSSGIWISSAMGSSGAIHSAGGRTLDWKENKFIYQSRELYIGFKSKYILQSGVLNDRQTLSITSFIRSGTIYIDGSHQLIPAPYGAKINIGLYPTPLNMLKV